MTDFNRMTRAFLLGESKKPSVQSYIQSIAETLDAIVPRTKGDSLKLEMARSNLREVRREFRRINERLNVLEEQVKVLEENKEN
jgi:RNA-splicing ligase RtcB